MEFPTDLEVSTRVDSSVAGASTKRVHVRKHI